MSDLKQIEEFIISTASRLVDSPEHLRLSVEQLNGRFVFVLFTELESEMGQLIGEKGAIAKALRTLTISCARRLGAYEITMVVSTQGRLS